MNILSLFDSSPVGLEGFDLRSAPVGAEQVPPAPSTLSRTFDDLLENSALLFY